MSRPSMSLPPNTGVQLRPTIALHGSRHAYVDPTAGSNGPQRGPKVVVQAAVKVGCVIALLMLLPLARPCQTPNLLCFELFV